MSATGKSHQLGLGHAQVKVMFGWKKNERKERKRRKEMKNPLFSWGEIEGEGGEENGGNRFPWISPFLFPYKLEGNEKKREICTWDQTL